MKRKLLSGIIPVLCLLFVSCSDNEENKSIQVTDGQQLTQEVFADETQSQQAVSFTTTAAWKSSITTGAPTRAGGAGWISIDPDHGDAAGTYTISITLTPNLTGSDRTAEIRILCAGEEIVISVSQKATKKDGTTPATVRLVKRIEEYNEWSDVDDKGNMISGIETETTTFQYDSEGRLVKYEYKYQEFDEPHYSTFSYPAAGSITVKTVDYERDRNGDGVIDEQDYVTYTATVNGNGYIVSISANGVDEEDEGSRMTYDAGGYLIKWEELYQRGEGSPSPMRKSRKAVTRNEVAVLANDYTVYTWQDGNLKKSVERYKEGTTDRERDIYSFTYTSRVPNMPCSIDLAWLVCEGELMPLGWLGKSPACLPDTEIYSDPSLDGYTTCYRYVKDAEGYVTAIYETEENSDEFLRWRIWYE